jgi:hypothetical protein
MHFVLVPTTQPGGRIVHRHGAARNCRPEEKIPCSGLIRSFAMRGDNRWSAGHPSAVAQRDDAMLSEDEGMVTSHRVFGGLLLSLTCCGHGMSNRDIGAVGPGSGTDDGGAVGLDDGGGAALETGAPAVDGEREDCSPIPNSAPMITPVTSTAAPPAPAGGALSSGTYYLTSLTFFTSGGGCTASDFQTSSVAVFGSMSATGGSVREDTSQTTTVNQIHHSVDTWSYVVEGTALRLTASCVGTLSGISRNASSPVPYTATSTGMQTFGAKAPCGTSVSVYTRQ